MRLNGDAQQGLYELVCEVAQEAGSLIRSRLGKCGEVSHKAGAETLASSVVTEVDGLVQSLVLSRLADAVSRFDLGVLAEESEDDGSRFVKDFFLAVDPLDGTLAFTRQEPGYAVSIALVARSGQPVLGVVHDPVTGFTYHAQQGQGAYRDGQKWQKCNLEPQADGVPLLLCVDQSMCEAEGWVVFLQHMENWAREQGLSGVSLQTGPGAVLQACSVMAHPCACYAKPPRRKKGGGHLWDIAATTCLADEMNVVAWDFTGRSLSQSGCLNQPETTMLNQIGFCFATSEELANEVLSAWNV